MMQFITWYIKDSWIHYLFDIKFIHRISNDMESDKYDTNTSIN